MQITVLCLSILLHSGGSVYDGLLSICCLSVVVILQTEDQISPLGSDITLNCSLGRSFTMSSYYMYWYRQNHYGAPLEFLTSEYEKINGRFTSTHKEKQNSFTLEINDTRLSDSSTYYCAAQHSDAHRAGKTGREPIPPTVKLFKPSAKEGDRTNKKTLVCLASNFYPDHVSVIWSINGNRHEGSTDSAAQLDGSFYRITSRLTVNAEQWHNPDNSFKCEVNFFNGETTITHQKTLKGVKGTCAFVQL
uniref:Ig-like domain-containing protein n=1 Tax=Gouania willdenowi TaxID=441366 RepID=A0A8C5DNE7_GOUWI